MNNRGTVAVYALFATVIVLLALLVLVPKFVPVFQGFSTSDGIYNFFLNWVFVFAGLAAVISFFIYFAVQGAS
jgi:type II secretory pathway component PulF